VGTGRVKLSESVLPVFTCIEVTGEGGRQQGSLDWDCVSRFVNCYIYKMIKKAFSLLHSAVFTQEKYIRVKI
jgi:hypothetical protein